MPSVETTLVVQSLLGDLVDAEAVAKMGPDSSSVHVPGQLHAVRRRRRPVTKREPMTPEQRRARLEQNVARASNAVGLTAGAAAIGSTARDERLKRGGRASRAIYRAGEAIPKPIERATRKIGPKGAAALAGGAFALQAGNVVGDVVTARVLGKKPVEKAVPLPKLLKGRIASFKTTMGLGGAHGRHGGGTLATGVQRNPNPIKPVPGVARGAVPSNAAGPLNARQVSAMGGAADARAKVEGFVATPGGKAALGLGGAAAIYGQGKRKGAEQAYYGKADVVDVGIEGTFSKFDDEKRRAYGWASVVTLDGEPVVDRQGDYIGLEDIEEAAYTYVRKSRVTGDMHRRAEDDTPHKAGELIESVVFTPDKCHAMGLPASFAGKWWMGVQVEDDEVWSEVKKGNRTGFSIHGKGLRKDTTLDDIKAGR